MATVDFLRTALVRLGVTGTPTEADVARALDVTPPPLGVRVPAEFDDTEDVRPFVTLLKAEDRTALGLPDLASVLAPAPVSTVKKAYQIRFHVIVCSNDDGSGAHATLEGMTAFYEKLVPEINKIFSVAPFEFVFSAKTDIETRKSTLLNQDFVPPAGLDLNKPPTESPLSQAQIDELSKKHEEARQNVSRQYPGKLVHFCVDGTVLAYREDPLPKQWVIMPRYGGYSSSEAEYVHVTSWAPADLLGHAGFLAHEMGHFFHLFHTFGGLYIKLTPQERATMNDAEELLALKKKQSAAVKAYIDQGHPAEQGLNVFNGDGIDDSPPDDGGAVIAHLNGGNGCGPIGLCEIIVEGQVKPYVLQPDRGNVMSYFKHCTNFAQHFSPGQSKVMQHTLEEGNRRHLLVSDRATPAVASRASGSLDIFGIGLGGGMWHKAWASGAWTPSETGWQNLGGSFVTRPAACSWGSDRVDVFAVGPDGAMLHKAWVKGAWQPSETGWENLGGQFAGAPAACSWGPNRLDVFAVGSDQVMWHKWWSNGAWHPSPTGWHNLGGQFTRPPAACSWAPDRLDIVGRGVNGAIWHKAWGNGKWTPSEAGWENLGGQFTSGPTICSWGPNRLDIFGLGLDRGVWHKAWTNGTWSPAGTGWESLGGAFISPPAVEAWGTNRLDIVGVGDDGAMRHKAWAGAWQPAGKDWQKVGGEFTSPPANCSWGANRLDVFATGMGRAMFHKSYATTGWYPSEIDWQALGGTFT